MENQEFENDFVILQLRDGVLYAKYKVSTIDLAIAKIATAFRLEVTGSKKLPVIADISCVKHVEKSARSYFASEEAGHDITALAVILSNPVTRTMGNFFLKFYQPEYPFRFFTNLNQAMNWIRESIAA